MTPVYNADLAPLLASKWQIGITRGVWIPGLRLLLLNSKIPQVWSGTAYVKAMSVLTYDSL